MTMSILDCQVAADITTPVFVDIMVPEACGPGMESISGAKSRMQARLTPPHGALWTWHLSSPES